MTRNLGYYSKLKLRARERKEGKVRKRKKVGNLISLSHFVYIAGNRVVSYLCPSNDEEKAKPIVVDTDIDKEQEVRANVGGSKTI